MSHFPNITHDGKNQYIHLSKIYLLTDVNKNLLELKQVYL